MEVALEKKVNSLPAQARLIVVKDKASLDRGHLALVYIKGLRKEINEHCDPLINSANETHKKTLAQKRIFMAPVIEAEGYLNPQIGSYLGELERIRLEAEEKTRLEKEVAAKKIKDEEDERLKAALKAEEEGKPEEAEKILDREPVQPIHDALTQQAAVPFKTRLQGLHVRKNWKWEPKDPVDFFGIPVNWMKYVPDVEKIDAYVKEHQEKADILGIRIYSKDTVIQRTNG